MKNVKKMLAITLVAVSVLAISAVALADAYGYVSYLGGDGSSFYLRRGHRGPQVTNLQIMLNEADYDCGEADGIFGGMTEDAVENLQGDYGLDVDGIVGGDTKYVLWAVLGETAPDDCVVLYSTTQRKPQHFCAIYSDTTQRGGSESAPPCAVAFSARQIH